MARVMRYCGGGGAIRESGLVSSTLVSPSSCMDEPSESCCSKRYRTTAKLGSISTEETDESDSHEEFT